MNGYQMAIQSYEHLLTEFQDNTKATADIKAHIKALSTVSDLTQKEICYLFDTGAFNEIVAGYVTQAANLAELTTEQTGRLVDNVRTIWDETPARDILAYFGKSCEEGET